MSAPANELALHLVRVIKSNPTVAYHLGIGSRTWELLIAAVGAITGETPDQVEHRLRQELIAAREKT